MLSRFDAASQRRELSTMAECAKILSQVCSFCWYGMSGNIVFWVLWMAGLGSSLWVWVANGFTWLNPIIDWVEFGFRILTTGIWINPINNQFDALISRLLHTVLIVSCLNLLNESNCVVTGLIRLFMSNFRFCEQVKSQKISFLNLNLIWWTSSLKRLHRLAEITHIFRSVEVAFGLIIIWVGFVLKVLF